MPRAASLDPLAPFRLAAAYDRYVADFFQRLAADAVGGAPVGVREFEDVECAEADRTADPALVPAVAALRRACGEDAARITQLLHAYDAALEAMGEDAAIAPPTLVACAQRLAGVDLAGAIDAHGALRFPVPPALAAAFEARGYWFDEAESVLACAGFSRFCDVRTGDADAAGVPAGAADEEVYSFAVVDERGLEVYTTHPAFARLAAGRTPTADSPVTADGTGHLTVSLPVPAGQTLDQVPADAVAARLDQLLAATAQAMAGAILPPTPRVAPCSICGDRACAAAQTGDRTDCEQYDGGGLGLDES